MLIGGTLIGLPALTRNAKREFEAKERQRQTELAEMRRQATSELENFLLSLVSEIKDPIEADYAFNGLKSIRKEYVGRIVDKAELEKIKSEVMLRVTKIKTEAAQQAAEWKRRKAQETKKETQIAAIEMMQENIKTDQAVNPLVVQEVLANLEALKKQAETKELSNEELQQESESATAKVEATVADETARKIVVRSIMESLQKTGFVVSNPKREKSEKDEVVILARKPAGQEAAFRIAADGKCSYKFDKYEGLKCKDDIEKVEEMLDDIYGIKLSDKRTLWQNPDHIKKGTIDNPNTTNQTRNKNG
jgi:hypothetical protein